MNHTITSLKVGSNHLWSILIGVATSLDEFADIIISASTTQYVGGFLLTGHLPFGATNQVVICHDLTGNGVCQDQIFQIVRKSAQGFQDVLIQTVKGDIRRSEDRPWSGSLQGFIQFGDMQCFTEHLEVIG
jgi:hypothetical protein